MWSHALENRGPFLNLMMIIVFTRHKQGPHCVVRVQGCKLKWHPLLKVYRTTVAEI